MQNYRELSLVINQHYLMPTGCKSLYYGDIFIHITSLRVRLCYEVMLCPDSPTY